MRQRPNEKFMITEAEYLHAQQIIDQYHLERQERAEWDLEADDEYYQQDDEDEDDILERRENDRFELALRCSCGAWIISQDKTKVLHVADCICGAE